MSVEGEQFASARAQNIAGLGRDHDLRSLSRTWQVEAARHNYIYNFSWLGRPIMQLLIGDYAPPERHDVYSHHMKFVTRGLDRIEARIGYKLMSV